MAAQESTPSPPLSGSDLEKQDDVVDLEKTSSTPDNVELTEEDMRPGAKAGLSKTQFWICLLGFVL